MGNAIDWNKVGAIGTWCFGIVGLAIYLFDRLRQAGNMPVTLAGWSLSNSDCSGDFRRCCFAFKGGGVGFTYWQTIDSFCILWSWGCMVAVVEI